MGLNVMPIMLADRADGALEHIHPSDDLPNIPPGFDLTDPDTCTTRVPDEELAELRRTAPVWWAAQRRGSAGQRVGLFYRSANFDEEVFDHPERFDIMRSPNPHLGYGGYGTHYCLGANLAKMEIELIFNAIADAMPDVAKAGDPVRLRSGWINGIRHLPVSYRG